MKKILFGFPEFNTWNIYFDTIINKYPNNIFMKELMDEININKLIKEYNIDLIFPLSFLDMELLSNSNIDCYYLSSKNFDVISMLNDKSKFVKYFMENNLENFLPKTYYIYFDNNKYVYNENIEFPAIQKTNIGFGGSDIYIINHISDLKEMDNYILQKYIQDNNEYTANIIFLNGKIIYYKVFKEDYQKDNYIKQGAMTNFEIVDLDINLFKPIFDTLKYNGACCLNFKYINNQIYLFEINPRLGGSLIRNYIFIEFLDNLLNSDENEFL